MYFLHILMLPLSWWNKVIYNVSYVYRMFVLFVEFCLRVCVMWAAMPELDWFELILLPAKVPHTAGSVIDLVYACSSFTIVTFYGPRAARVFWNSGRRIAVRERRVATSASAAPRSDTADALLALRVLWAAGGSPVKRPTTSCGCAGGGVQRAVSTGVQSRVQFRRLRWEVLPNTAVYCLFRGISANKTSWSRYDVDMWGPLETGAVAGGGGVATRLRTGMSVPYAFRQYPDPTGPPA